MPKIGEKNLDLRLVERFIHQGSLKKSEYDKHINTLPDDAENTLETRPGDPEYEAQQDELELQRKAAKAAAASSVE